MLELIINGSKFYQNITDGAGKWIGETYQDLLIDRESGKYIGINQGYAFNFGDGSSSEVNNAEVNNNIMFMEGKDQIYWSGNAIIWASGNYSKYQGGNIFL